MVRKVVGKDKGHIYAMKVLKKATLKGKILYLKENGLFLRLQSRSHWKCTKHAAASKLYNNELVILNAASFYVSMSSRLPLLTFKLKLGSEVKISGKQTPSTKPCFSKLKCRQFLYI